MRVLKLIAGVASAAFLMAAAATITGDKIPANSGGDITVHPLKHATLVLAWNGKTIYVDPAPAPGGPQGADGAAAFQGLPPADIILVTDIHGDHFHPATLEKVTGANTVIVAPQAVVDKMPEALKGKARALANGASATVATISVEAVPMYNTTADRLKFHEKGRGNGYVVNLGGKRVYIAGDTEDVPEMHALKNIDVAFIPMNLPYTMPPEQAARGVLAFKPKIVYPYHYGESDLAAFTKALGTNSGIEVRQRTWY
jgi:L-ascorbate metabolism protein UlaG (beta-lactamase superfamily)